MINADILRSLLDYDPNTGVFTWRVARRGGAQRNSVAGSKNRLGYVKIHICGKSYWAHRLAWLYIYGVWPSDFIDHINCEAGDNRIANLRIATNAQNMANRRKRVFGLPKGVVKNGKKFRARICVDRKLRCLGTYDTPEEAHAEYCAAAQKAFGAYHRAG